MPTEKMLERACRALYVAQNPAKKLPKLSGWQRDRLHSVALALEEVEANAFRAAKEDCRVGHTVETQRLVAVQQESQAWRDLYEAARDEVLYLKRWPCWCGHPRDDHAATASPGQCNFCRTCYPPTAVRAGGLSEIAGQTYERVKPFYHYENHGAEMIRGHVSVRVMS